MSDEDRLHLRGRLRQTHRLFQIRTCLEIMLTSFANESFVITACIRENEWRCAHDAVNRVPLPASCAFCNTVLDYFSQIVFQPNARIAWFETAYARPAGNTDFYSQNCLTGALHQPDVAVLQTGLNRLDRWVFRSSFAYQPVLRAFGQVQHRDDG